MNTVFAKSLVYLALLCYLFGASVASAHAFPERMTSPDTLNVSMDMDMDMGVEAMVDCHQGDNDQAMSSSMCKIFCAAMSNLVSLESLEQTRINPESVFIAFSPPPSGGSEPSMEPHPPK